MGKINLVISDKLETEFRETVFKKFGMKKGNIAKATEEALNEWVKANQKQPNRLVQQKA